MDKNSYLLTITIPVGAMDDPDARAQAELAIPALGPDAKVKLQEIFENQPPRRIKLAEGPSSPEKWAEMDQEIREYHRIESLENDNFLARCRKEEVPHEIECRSGKLFGDGTKKWGRAWPSREYDLKHGRNLI